jgi:hypothetical protein
VIEVPHDKHTAAPEAVGPEESQAETSKDCLYL